MQNRLIAAATDSHSSLSVVRVNLSLSQAGDASRAIDDCHDFTGVLYKRGPYGSYFVSGWYKGLQFNLHLCYA